VGHSVKSRKLLLKKPIMVPPSDGLMFLLKLCFSFSGRIDRAMYWLGIVMAFWIGALGMMSSRLMPNVSASLIIALALMPAYLVIALAVAVKRLHDLDVSGWWAFGFLIAWYLTVGIFELAQKPPSIGAAISALLFAGVIWLGSAKGLQSENRFGPEPIARTRKRTSSIGLSNAPDGIPSRASPSATNRGTRRQLPRWFWKLLGLWGSFAVIWVGYILSQPSGYWAYYLDPPYAFAFLPPIISLSGGLLLVWAWQRYVEVHWLKLPEHLRRGLLRLYLVVAVPWVGWIGFQILINGPRWRYLSNAFWSLLVVPVGGPVLVLVILWVFAGFRKPSIEIGESIADPQGGDSARVDPKIAPPLR
jgi:uncharacterized membrane protein YhaH (DUF805 family)